MPLPRQRSLARQAATHRGSALGSKPEPTRTAREGDAKNVITAEDAAADRTRLRTEDPTPGHAANRSGHLEQPTAPAVHCSRDCTSSSTAPHPLRRDER
jgi:hypothetical protein